MSDYAAFLAGKRPRLANAGIEVPEEAFSRHLFPFQRDLARWALRKGRAAIFADTGLGKTRMQLEWARLSGERALILAPLSVARQTVREAEVLGIDAKYARSQADVDDGAVTVTNYEMVHAFDPEAFGAVVLDESSILKNTASVYRNLLTEMFSGTPFRLCCTATPAPNDIAEITNHSAFLGVMPRRDVLATFFLHDADTARADGWRLKRHAREAFWQWLASWGMLLKSPADLGYSDEGYRLPELRIVPTFVGGEVAVPGRMFVEKLRGVTERAAVRRQTVDARTAAAVDLIRDDRQPWIAWCGLNDESSAIAEALGDEAVEVTGPMSPEEKAERLEAFVDGRYRVLVTKPSIAGFGMNFQHCARMAFVGLSDSYEQYYQAIRRCWRFGQVQPVEAHVVLSEPERTVFDNVLRKEREAEEMAAELVKHVTAYEVAEIDGRPASGFTYRPREESGPGWKMLLGDSAERMKEIPDESIDLSVFSPPFQALYVYSPTERDLGNCATPEEFFEHLDYITAELFRAMKPGRLVAVHCAQITAQKVLDGYIGLKDFRGALIEHYTRHGFTYHREVCIDKDPQAQAIRTHSKALLFVQKRKDRSWLGPAIADFILLFRKGIGDPAVPINQDEMTDDEWIEWARPIWYGIRETDTLQAPPKANDERHVAPLQLGVIERVVRLWSNPGEMVLSPFAGIGSEGFEALRLGRRFTGIELKPEYFEAAVRNLRAARLQGTLDLEVVP